MKRYINLIKQILIKGGSILTFEKLNSFFITNEQASDEDIIKCDTYFNRKIPEEYKYLLKHYNGCILFEYDGIAGFQFLSTFDIVQENVLVNDIFNDEDWYDNVILFCKILGNGEYLGFRLQKNSKYEIVHCFLDMLPEEWPIIGNSFDILIETLIKEKGKEYWLY
ncbi:hypothetical protein AGMMS50262_22850 [Bacteroidia bacterium]|nr:hypothetical protein AGMMS50262_22850 [Bacteroidia bacterium]